MAEIAAGINGRLKKSLFMPPSVGVDYRGSRMAINYFRGGNKNGPPHLDIFLFKKPPFRLSIIQRTALPKILQNISLLKNMVINVPDFDNKFLIRTSDKAKCLIYLSNYRKREVIEGLYASGWQVVFERTRIKLTTNSITAHASDGAGAVPKQIGSWGIRQIFGENLWAGNYLPILDALTAEYVSGILEELHLLSESWV